MIDFLSIYSEYNTLPKLHKIDHDNIFDNDLSNSSFYIDEKLKLNTEKNLNCLSLSSEYVCLPEIKSYVRDFIIKNHPLRLYRKYTSRSLDNVVSNIPEDVTIHRLYNEVDWLAYTNVSFPSGWSPEKSVGKSFKELHSHIPGINLTHTENMLQSCVHKGPFERFVWGIYFEAGLDHHGDRPRKTFEETSEFYVKVERQVIVGIPEYNSFMFILRPYIIDQPDIKVLYNILSGMDLAQRAYKNITDNFLNHLRGLL